MVTRRDILASTAFVPVAAITSAAQTAQSVFTPAERRILEALVDRLIPKDDLGPGAVECGVADYIDRSLADYLSGEKASFVEGLTAMDARARQSHGAGFADLQEVKRDEVLTAMDNAFFARVRRLTLEGMFGDPHYGGNRNYAGWDLIRYPGPRLAVSPEEQKLGVEVKALHASAWGTGHSR